MKLSVYLNSMYGWVTATLVFLALVAGYALNQIPTNLVLAVLLAAIIDVLLKKRLLGKAFEFPKSAIITGLIIGSVAPINAPPVVILVAVVAALFSKFVIRVKGTHIFNPAAFGILVALPLFGLIDQWWPAMHYTLAGYPITLSFLLIFANHKANKLRISIPFLVVGGVLLYLIGIFTIPTPSLTSVLGFLAALPYFFGFVMVSEPKTTPSLPRQQVAFGVGVAVLMSILLFYGFNYALFIALLVCNLLFFAYRTLKKKRE